MAETVLTQTLALYHTCIYTFLTLCYSLTNAIMKEKFVSANIRPEVIRPVTTVDEGFLWPIASRKPTNSNFLTALENVSVAVRWLKIQISRRHEDLLQSLIHNSGNRYFVVFHSIWEAYKLTDNLFSFMGAIFVFINMSAITTSQFLFGKQITNFYALLVV